MNNPTEDSRLPEEIVLKPVGYVRSELKVPQLKADNQGITLRHSLEEAAREARHIRELVSEIVIDARHDGILDGIEDFSHVLVLYWPHLVPPPGRRLTRVHPIGRREYNEVGIFASCSPARPNPILVTAARLKERNGLTLKVQGLEAVDGSPVIDLKPYVSSYYRIDRPVLAPWMAEIEREISSL